jgi:hypothetical protein
MSVVLLHPHEAGMETTRVLEEKSTCLVQSKQIRKRFSTSKISTQITILIYKTRFHGPFSHIIYLKKDLYLQQQPKEEGHMEEGRLGHNFNTIFLSSFLTPSSEDSYYYSSIHSRNHAHV